MHQRADPLFATGWFLERLLKCGGLIQKIGKIKETSNQIKGYTIEYHILYLPCCGISEKNDTKNEASGL